MLTDKLNLINHNGSREVQVAIADSERGSYLLSPDIERGILEPYADVTLHRVKTQEELFGRMEEADAIISWHHIPIQRDGPHLLWQCATCGKCLSERRGTAFFNLKTPEAEVCLNSPSD